MRRCNNGWRRWKMQRELFAAPRLKVGVGNAHFLADLADGVSDAEMRKRWAAGHYDGPDGRKPREDYVRGWRELNGRKAT